MTNPRGNPKVHGEVGKGEFGKKVLSEGHVVLVTWEGDITIKETILGKDPVTVNGTIEDSVISWKETKVRKRDMGKEEKKEKGGQTCFHYITESIKISQISLSKQPHLHF